MTPHSSVTHRSQLVAYPFFLSAAILFVLQVIFGLIIAAQYVWPQFLMDTLPFNFGRASHLNLMIFWLILGLMGASYYLVADETDSKIFSVPLAWANLVVLLVAGVGTLATYWFFHVAQGKPFTEAPMPWPLLIALGVVLFLVNIGVTLYRARKWNAITFTLAFGMVGLTLLYLLDLPFFRNLTVDYYWWWWIIHLWVEGTWEIIASAIMAYLLVKLTDADRTRVAKWMYAEVALVLFTGIVGIGHHYYWIGTPRYWLLWGAVFSALEPVPLVLMVWDTFTHMKHRHPEPVNHVTWYWLGGSAIGHLVGAGVWGFAMTLPQINKWTHGTQVTASHGHFAFFGAFAMLVIAAMYYMVPRLRGMERYAQRRAMWAFWLMCIGMLAMVIAFTVAGVVQTYLVRLLGMDFMTVRTEYVSFWIFWVWAAGLVLFLPGVLAFLWDFLAGKPAVQPAPAAGVVI
ncbi:MAG TPA: cbb3-type cytochrome c oxidase subunit I [Gemmatimonadales bacterium]|nr:cbb3-type cytochrome c oxidase subunit I [Gemmatimonadales bacterium]